MMMSTIMCTVEKGNGKVKIVWRSLKSNLWGWQGRGSKRKRGRGEEGRVLMKSDVGRSHITMNVKQVHLIALLHPRVAKKYTLKSTRGEY